jgi:glycosyltransferase involved in cell wall biosynthesis
MPIRRATVKLRVGIGAELAALPGTGHGNVWRQVLDQLRSMRSIRLVERGGADVWLSSSTAPPPDGRPLVVQVHEIGWREPELRQFLQPEFAAHMEGLVTAALAAASHVITPSEAARSQVIEACAWPPDHVHAVPHGVDHRLFRPGRAGAPEPLGAPYVLFVGVLHPRKNLDAVRTALAGLAGRGLPHVLVAVANAPPDRPEPGDLEAGLQVPALPGRLRLLRHVADRDLASLMSHAAAFCLPSFFEGFGLPALEAMACGAPVIVSNRGALPEVVGDAALIVEPEPAAVEEALLHVLTDNQLALRLRDAGLRRAAGFHWRRTAEGWLEVLRFAASDSP